MQYEDIVYEMHASAVWITNNDIWKSREGVRAIQEKRKPDSRRWEK